MQYCKYFLITSSLLFFSAGLFAQSESPVDMTGLWTGLMYNDTTELNYRYEIAISEKNGKLTGFSHTFFILDGIEYYGVKKLKISIEGDKVITQDLKLIDNNYPIRPPKGVYVLNVLNFEMKNAVMILSGMFSTNRTRQYAPATGYIHVEKKTDLRRSALVTHLQKMGLGDELSFVEPEKQTETKPLVKAETVTEQPVVIAKPAEKIKPVKEKATETKPLVKTETVTEQPVVKVKPIETEKPVKEKATKTIPLVKAEKVTEQPVVKIKPIEKVEPVKEKATAVTAAVIKKEPEKAIVLTQAAVDINNRVIETIQSVNYASDSLVLTLYDNGEVDGDTVSVLMNGEVIMPMVGLSTNAVRKTIYTRDITDSIKIVMYAETLGSLPPNTGLLIVNDGKDRYEIRFSGDLKKNAAIVFKKRAADLK